MPSILYTLAIVTTTFLYDVSAFSTGTGSCGEGISSIENNAVGNTHIQYADFPGSTSTRPGARTTLTEAGAVVQVNGIELIDAITSIPVGTDVIWEVIATESTYKGIFVRVDKASDDFTLIASDTTTLQNVALCDTLVGVAGVTHTSSVAKTSSSGTINFASTGIATLDVILVIDNVASSLYSWSSFTLRIGDDVTPIPPTTPPPISTPETTPAPVDGTTMEPVSAPVATPAPVATSTPEATPAPVPVDGTPSPTADPTEFRTLEPTKRRGMIDMGMRKGMMNDMRKGMMNDMRKGMMNDMGKGMMNGGGMGMKKEQRRGRKQRYLKK